MLLNSIEVNDFDADRDGVIASGTAPTDWCWGAGDPDVACAAASTCAAVGDPPFDNLAALLACYYAITSEIDGLRACGCAI